MNQSAESMDIDTPSVTSVPETQLETQILSQTETETQTQKSPSTSSRIEDTRESKARQNVEEPDEMAKFQWRRGRSSFPVVECIANSLHMP